MTTTHRANPGAVVSAYTGTLACKMSAFHEYAETVLGRPIWTHELADKAVVKELKAASRDDFLELCDLWSADPDSEKQGEGK